MLRKKLWISLSIAVSLVIVLVACNKEAVSKINFIFQPDPGNGVVAEIEGEKITEDQLFVGMEKAQLHQKEMELYDMKMNKLRAVILEKLIAKDDRKKDLSNDDFLEKYIAQGAEPSKSEIDNFIKERNIPKEQVDQLMDRIKQYLSMEKKKESIEKWMAKKTQKTPITVFIQKPEIPAISIDLGKAPVSGPADAKVTIIEYTDFQCPFCAKAHETFEKIKKQYKGKIRFAVKHYPLPFHTDGKRAAEASLCANDQGDKYLWLMNDKMFSNQQKLDQENLVKMAEEVGLDKAKFSECLSSNKFAAAVDADINQGQELRLNSVPAFFINGKLINGAQPEDVFVEVIESELKTK